MSAPNFMRSQLTFDLMVRLLVSVANIDEIHQYIQLREPSSEVPQLTGSVTHPAANHCSFEFLDIRIKLNHVRYVGHGGAFLFEVLLQFQLQIMDGLVAAFDALMEVLVLKLGERLLVI
jgi:hypothetical protein